MKTVSQGRERIREALRTAARARKCHACGCFQDAVASLDSAPIAESIGPALAAARRAFAPRRYDCLGCAVCWPADAVTAASEQLGLTLEMTCGGPPPRRRAGWPPLPGDYRVLCVEAPVAVCTLHSLELPSELEALAPDGLSVVGSLRTENLGIERLVENTLANPFLRVLLLCGEDTAGRIGHFPGQSLLALARAGVDDAGRIHGARGKRPRLVNLPGYCVERFRRQVQVVDRRGVTDVRSIASLVEDLGARAPGTFDEDAGQSRRLPPTVEATGPGRLSLDPAGYVVIHPDARRGILVAEHYENRGVLRAVVHGRRAIDVMATLLGQGAVTRLDHAAYLGGELARAEMALEGGIRYVQDEAPESTEATGCSPGEGCCG